MKKTYLILVLMVLSLAACDVLDVKPYHSIPAEDAIRTREDVQSAVNGTYSGLQFVGYYGRNFLVAGDLAADNLTWTGTTAGYNQIDNNSILADNVIVEGIWSAIYRFISRANYVIDRIPEVDDLSQEEANAFLAELHFLRALGHFDLVRLFGPVPIRTKPATASDDDLNVPRRPVEDVYSQVFDDLNFALEHIRPNVTRGLASKASVLALQARVSLFYYSVTGQEDYLHQAIDKATMVIEDFGLQLEPSFAKLFDGSPNTESIFEVNFTEQDRNRLAEYFFPTSLSGRREFSPTEKLFEAYGEGDQRRDVSIGQDGNNLYGLKYNDIETGSDNVYVLRLAEMYLIRAEARAMLATSVALARDDINEIRVRAGLEPVTTTAPSVLRQQVMDMRQQEFAFEGQRWFDLVRTGQAIDVLEYVTEECQTLFPIPLGELLTNFHEGMYQNDCY